MQFKFFYIPKHIVFIERYAINLFSFFFLNGSTSKYSFRFIGINMKFLTLKLFSVWYTGNENMYFRMKKKIQLLKSLHPQNGNYSRGNPQ